jgi:hypothetical protein
MRDQIRYYMGDQLIPEVGSIKYLGIIIRRDLNWVDHVKHGRLSTS